MNKPSPFGFDQKYHLSVFSILLLMVSSLLPSNSLAANSRDFVQGSYAHIIETHKNHSFFVSLWSIDCPPCREELPEMEAYFSRHQEISLILISTDGKDLAAEVEQVLQRNGLADAESWIFAEDFVERLRYEVDSTWHGELPRSYFYSPGQPRQKISGRINFKQGDD